MKRTKTNLFLISLTLIFSLNAGSQTLLPINDPFDYPSGTLLSGQGGWSDTIAAGNIKIISNNLIFSKYFNPDYVSMGNCISLGNELTEITLLFTTQTGDKKVYYSFLLNIINLNTSDTTSRNVIGLANGSKKGAVIWYKPTSNGHFKIGISPRNNQTQIVWYSSDFPYNQTLYLVAKYELKTGATNNDNIRFWVDPYYYEQYFDVSIDNNSGTDLTQIDRLYIQQIKPAIGDSLLIDEINISNNFSEVRLPVELSSFSLNKTSLGVTLNWSTKSETNNAGWEIEYRQLTTDNGQQKNSEFRKVGFVSGKGTTVDAQNYRFIFNPSGLQSSVSGLQFRLKQIDSDGKFQYSSIEEISVLADKFELIGNYPNPFNPTTKIAFNLPKDANVRVSVSNILGQEIAVPANRTFKAGNGITVDFNAANFSTGIYFYTVTVDGKSYTKSMMLMK